MHFACITPTDYLDQFAGKRHFQLCLANVAIRDAKYFEWYRKRRELGDFVILDNGAYEGELVTFNQLCEVATRLNPQVLTIPDKINDTDVSLGLMEDFMSEAGRHLPREVEFIRVFQSAVRNPIIWQEMVGEEVYERKWSWIALPRILGEARLAIAQAVLEVIDITDTKVHAFGWIGNLNEVRALAKLGVTSIDTSAPVWRGLNGVGLYDQADSDWEASGPKFNPNPNWENMRLSNEKFQLVQKNLAAIERACVAF